VVAFTLSGTGATALPTVRMPGMKCRNIREGRPASSKCKSCSETFYRVTSLLTSVTLQVALPPACETGPCAPLTLVADGCSSVYSDQPQTVISRSDYSADAGTCAGIAGTLGVVTQPQQPMLVVRSSADPRVTAGQLTLCSFMFGPTAKQTRTTAIGLLSAGSIVTCCCFITMFGAYNTDQDAEAANADAAKGGEPAAQVEVFVPQQPPVVVVYTEQPPQQLAYGAQVPAYGQQQQTGYGQQQQTGYGQQQQTGYGGPVYGAPATEYPATEYVEVPPPPVAPVAPTGPAGGRGGGRGRGRAGAAPGRGGRGPQTPRSSQQGGSQQARSSQQGGQHPPQLMPLPPTGGAGYDKTQY
jgi:hypothetical protein